jgi:hypothetical protein
MNHSGVEHLLFDDCDSESDDGDGRDGRDGRDGDGGLDTKWIAEYERRIMYDEYRLLLKTDVTEITFEFYYLNCDKSCVERIVTAKCSLMTPNQITQNELFSMIRSYQHVDKKYYNFNALLFYSFDFLDDGKELSRYLRGGGGRGGRGRDRFIEYTNLLSIDTIYISPVLTIFHDVIGFTVLLYED